MAGLRYPTPDLTDGSTLLRAWTLDDLECVEEASTDPRIPESTTVPAAYSDAAGREFIERQWSRLDQGAGLSLAIASSTTDAALGLVVLTLRPQTGVAGIGYWILPSSRVVGHASRAVRMLTEWALTDTGLARVEAWVEPENLASQLVLTAAGFAREGTLRSFLAFPTRRADAMVFSRIAPG